MLDIVEVENVGLLLLSSARVISLPTMASTIAGISRSAGVSGSEVLPDKELVELPQPELNAKNVSSITAIAEQNKLRFQSTVSLCVN